MSKVTMAFCAADLGIRAPAGIRLRVREDAGYVIVRGAPADISINTDVGDIGVDVARAPRRIAAQSDAGEIRVAVPRGTYAVDTATTVGDITVEDLVRDDRVGRTIRVSTDAGDAAVEGR